MNGTEPIEQYRQLILRYTNQLTALKKTRSRLGWFRLVAGVAIFASVYALFFSQPMYLWLATATSIACLLYLISKDANNNAQIKRCEILLAINEREVEFLTGNWAGSMEDSGLGYMPSRHLYAPDLDLFGQSSLYQYINRCTSEQGKDQLAKLFLESSLHRDIEHRQQSAKQAAPYINWRQELQAFGWMQPITRRTEECVAQWLVVDDKRRGSFWYYLPTIFTVITFGSLALFVTGFMAASTITILVFTFFLIAKFAGSQRLASYEALSGISDEISSLQQQLRHIEQHPQRNIFALQNETINLFSGSGRIAELHAILKKFDFRLNLLVAFLLNSFLLWDVRQANNLQQWKTRHGASFSQWFLLIGHTDVINTLATLTFNHPQWTFPTFVTEPFTLRATALAHPLISPRVSVSNSFSTSGSGHVVVITGSNMAGKSTFLRSIGVNLVLANLGGPVCAEKLVTSTTRLYSSMRIADNLAESTSTFYAELKKLKAIIEKVNQHEHAFVLLDEILRGTNSLDRHVGSVALIKQFLKKGAHAIIATHDVELAKLSEETAGISNYHFDVQVAGDELYFDYKLKPGICQSLNASLLMKKIGIEIET